MISPQEARVRLAAAREDMRLARIIYGNRIGIDPNAGIVAALDKVIQLLEDALV